MNKMVKELLRKQENERVEMATLLVSNTKEMLSNLGCDYMLDSASGTDVPKYEAIINSLKEELKAAKKNKTVELVKEVEVPVEVQVEKKIIPKWCWYSVIFNLIVLCYILFSIYLTFKK